MWLRDLTSLVTRLTEISQLLREQNQLTRELILASTGRPSTTTKPMPPSRQPLRRPYTDADVSVATRASLARIDDLKRDQQQAPWRHPMDTLADLEAQQLNGDARQVATPPQSH